MESKEAYKDKIHDWFGLTYASYLVVQRSVLQSMPDEWQEKFTALLKELDQEVNKLEDYPSDFWVRAKSGNKFVHDPYRDYHRGRRKVFNENKNTNI